MKKFEISVSVCFLLTILSATFLLGQTVETPKITVDATVEGIPMPPDLYGIFFEELNHCGDGGLYAEMIRNRSFEDHRIPEGTRLEGDHVVGPRKGWKFPWRDDKFPGWKLVPIEADADMFLDTETPIHPNNPTSLRLKIKGLSSSAYAGVRLDNEGFWGVAVRKGEEYRLTFYAKSSGNVNSFDVSIAKNEGASVASATVKGIGHDWKKHTLILKAGEDYAEGRLVLFFQQKGTVWLDEVSLFPVKTWKGRENGLRVDLMQKLVDMKPAFVRFPGGCIVEGCTLDNAWLPTTTLGPPEHRPSRWNVYGYRSTQGLGYHEYLLMTEDLGAAGMLVVNCGMACEGRDGGAAPLDEMQPWIDETLNAIEYAIGPIDSKFGKMRAEAGHSEPFNLKYVEFGNENWFPEFYIDRYKMFYEAVKAKYPQLKTISNIPMPEGLPIEIQDDHFYMIPDHARQMIDFYNLTDRNGPEIYVGEYAVNRKCGLGNLDGALGEACMMIGFEKNADVVTMSSYAPLFYNVHDRNWPVNLIGFDNHRCFGTPSYYVQKLFSTEKGDRILPTLISSKDREEEDAEAPCSGGIALGGGRSPVEFKDVEVLSPGGKTLYRSDFSSENAEWKTPRGNWSIRNGVFRQDDVERGGLAILDHSEWKDCTLKLKARKIGNVPGNVDGSVDERDGFQISVRYASENKRFRLVFGDWKNRNITLQRHGEREYVLRQYVRPKLRLENDRWYDIEIKVSGKRLEYSVDGKLITAYDNIYLKTDLPSITSIAHRDTKNDEILLRVVHHGTETQEVEVDLKGIEATKAEAEKIVLTSASLEDENTLENLEFVAPKRSMLKNVAPRFKLSLEPRSLTLLRIKNIE